MGSTGMLVAAVVVAATPSFESLRERAAVAHIVVAGDPFGEYAARTRATDALRHLNSPTGFDFMADYVRVSFGPPGFSATTELQPLRERLPFYYGLTHDGRGRPRREDEAVAAAILGALDRTRDDVTLASYSFILPQVLADERGEGGYERTRERLLRELGRRPDATRKANLEGVLTWLYRNHGLDDAGRPLVPPRN